MLSSLYSLYCDGYIPLCLYDSNFNTACLVGRFESWLTVKSGPSLSKQVASCKCPGLEANVKHSKKSRKYTELLSRQINDLVTDIAQLKSMIQVVRMCNLKFCTSQQILLYSLETSCLSHLFSNKHKGAISAAASGRFFQVDNDLPAEQPLSTPVAYSRLCDSHPEDAYYNPQVGLGKHIEHTHSHGICHSIFDMPCVLTLMTAFKELSDKTQPTSLQAVCCIF